MDAPRHTAGAVTREKLMEAAGEIFAEKGLHGAVLRDITQRAGANIAAVNYHFHDKFELYAQVLRHVHEGVLTTLNQPLTAGTPEGRVRQLLSGMLTVALDPARPKWHTRLLGREMFQPTPALDQVHDLVQSPAQRLREAVREIRPDLPERQAMLAVCSIVATSLFYIHYRHIARRLFPTLADPSVATLVEHVVDYTLAALRGLPASNLPARVKRRTTGRRTTPRPATRSGQRKPSRGAD